MLSLSTMQGFSFLFFSLACGKRQSVLREIYPPKRLACSPRILRVISIALIFFASISSHLARTEFLFRFLVGFAFLANPLQDGIHILIIQPFMAIFGVVAVSCFKFDNILQYFSNRFCGQLRIIFSTSSFVAPLAKSSE